MRNRLLPVLSLILVAVSVQAQDLLVKPEARKANDLSASNTGIFQAQQQITPRAPKSDANSSIIDSDDLPNKPQPIAYAGQWISEGDPMPHFPDDLIMTERKDDGRLKWHVERINSCAWCATPISWKQAMFDKEASSMWILRSALAVADIEITHHTPCFIAGTCKEANPLIGRTRLQGYSVAAGFTAFGWIGGGWLRKGSRENRVGGYKHWWIIPTIGDASSAVGIIGNISRWHIR